MLLHDSESTKRLDIKWNSHMLKLFILTCSSVIFVKEKKTVWCLCPHFFIWAITIRGNYRIEWDEWKYNRAVTLWLPLEVRGTVHKTFDWNDSGVGFTFTFVTFITLLISYGRKKSPCLEDTHCTQVNRQLRTTFHSSLEVVQSKACSALV